MPKGNPAGYLPKKGKGAAKRKGKGAPPKMKGNPMMKAAEMAEHMRGKKK